MTKYGSQHSCCSMLSLESGEGMFSTVPRVNVWFLLEYRGAWNEKAFALSEIPESVKRQISTYLVSAQNPRLQLIKRHKNLGDSLKFYIGISDAMQPKLFEYDFSDYEELLSLEVDEIMQDGRFLRKEPLFLVCTHGAHDPCCADYGMPVYLEAAKNESGYSAWQCTHLGGHRFAANLLCLPHGIYYGRLRKEDVRNVIGEYASRRISVESYRGRSCYSREAQAGEYYLRQSTGVRDIEEFFLKHVGEKDGGVWVLEFVSRSDGKTHHLRIRRDSSALTNYTSCKDRDVSPIGQYRLIEYRKP